MHTHTHTHTVVFGDNEMAAKILASTVPKEQKGFGRSVSNFDAHVWTIKCRDVVKAGNRAKVMTYYSCGFQYDPQHGVVIYIWLL